VIEQAVLLYLNSHSGVLASLGGQAKVYYARAPKDINGVAVTMPWVVVRNSGGMRNRVTQTITDTEDTSTIYVEDSNQFRGRAIAEAVLTALENYRGDMAPELDVHIRCGSIRDLDGWQNSFRYIVTAYVLYKKTTVFPN
jgi:hypothetical protein